MTKLRAPLTFERALVRIADRLGWDRMAEITGRSTRSLTNYSDPDTDTCVCIEHALQLDAAFRADGGEGAPLLDCYRLRLEAAEVAHASNRDRLLDGAILAIKEAGEANAALVEATRPGADAGHRAIARREVEEAVAALTATLAHLHDRDDAP